MLVYGAMLAMLLLLCGNSTYAFRMPSNRWSSGGKSVSQ